MFKKKRKKKKEGKKTYTGEKARNIHHYALLPKPNKHSCRSFGGSPSAFIPLEHNSFVNVSYGKIKMNEKTKSSSNGYQRHFEFSYNVVIETQMQIRLLAAPRKSSHFFLILPNPKFNCFVKKKKKYREKCCRRENMKDPRPQQHWKSNQVSGFYTGRGKLACTKVHLMQRNKTAPC